MVELFWIIKIGPKCKPKCLHKRDRGRVDIDRRRKTV